MAQTPKIFPVADGDSVYLSKNPDGIAFLRIDNEFGVASITLSDLRQMGAAFIAFADGEEA